MKNFAVKCVRIDTGGGEWKQWYLLQPRVAGQQRQSHLRRQLHQTAEAPAPAGRSKVEESIGA